MTIVQNIIDTFCAFFQKIGCLFLAWIMSLCDMHNFKPNIYYFRSIFFQDSANFDKVVDIFKVGGLFVALILFGYNIYISLAGLIIEYKENFFLLLVRFAAVCLAITISLPFLDNALKAGNAMSNYVTTIVGDGTMLFNNELKNDAVDGAQLEIFANTKFEPESFTWKTDEDVEDERGNLDGYADAAKMQMYFTDEVNAALAIIFGAFNLIIRAILFFVCGWFLLKLYLELVKRYMYMSCLYMMFPTACGFLASGATTTIFFTYLRMFGVEIGVLVLTRLWIALSMFVMGSLPSGTFSFIVIIAFINIGIKMENTLKDMGLSVSSTGPALLDSMAATAGGMIYMAKRSTSGALTNIGAAKGNMALVAVGNAMSGKPISPDAIANAANASIGGAIRQRMTSDSRTGTGASTASSIFGKPNTSSNLTESKKQNMFDLLNENSRMSKDAFTREINSGLNSAGRQEMFDAITTSQFGDLSNTLNACGEGSKLNINSYDQYSGFGTSITDENGNVLASGTISEKQSPTGRSINFTDASGRQRYLNLDNPGSLAAETNGVSPLAPGESVPVGKNAGSGLTMAELRTNADMSSLSSLYDNGVFKDGDMQFIGTADGGFDIYTGCADKEQGTLSAHQFKDGSIAYLSQRWNNANQITDGSGATRTREEDFASMFEPMTSQNNGQSNGNDSTNNGEKNAAAVGTFANMGYDNVHNVEFLNKEGTEVKFSYTDSSNETKQAKFTQLVGNEATLNQKPNKQNVFDGGTKYGTWVATPLKTPISNNKK